MKEKLLLHICCGPCSTAVIERLSEDWDITGYFYNPNIQPDDEYHRRLQASFAVSLKLGIPLITGGYDPDIFTSAVRGMENEPENGARCLVCYRLRLAGAAKRASEGDFGIIASTLTVGPSKKAPVIDSIGHEEAAKYGVSFLPGDWKKMDGFKKSCELSRNMGLYRQNYCGCVYSKRD